MKCVVIDFGMNMFNVLVVEVSVGSFCVLYIFKQGVVFGMGGINEGYIMEEVME